MEKPLSETQLHQFLQLAYAKLDVLKEQRRQEKQEAEFENRYLNGSGKFGLR